MEQSDEDEEEEEGAFSCQINKLSIQLIITFEMTSGNKQHLNETAVGLLLFKNMFFLEIKNIIIYSLFM